MGATIQDIFGQADTAEPATPGTYGEAPSGYRLPEQIRLGPVRLQVSDLARSLAFYQDVLGLSPLERDTTEASLAPQESDIPLVHLRARRGARTLPKRGALGLYHFAILLPDRPSLGRFVRHLGEINARAGAGDHLVSESLYLQDPDNLGIEVYADRPRSTWRRIGRELMMATDPVDFADLIAAAGDERWSGILRKPLLARRRATFRWSISEPAEARERYRSAGRSVSITLPFCCPTGRHWADSFAIWVRSTLGPAPAIIW